MANIFKEAKKIQKAHPRMTWQAAIKEASRKHKKVGATKTKKKTRYRQTGASSKHADEVRRAKRPGKRKSASGKVYYERRKNRTDVPFSLTGFKSHVKEKLGKALLEYELATTVKATKTARKKVIANRKLLKSI